MPIWISVGIGFCMGFGLSVILSVSITIRRALQVGQMKRDVKRYEDMIAKLTQEEVHNILARLDAEYEERRIHVGRQPTLWDLQGTKKKS